MNFHPFLAGVAACLVLTLQVGCSPDIPDVESTETLERAIEMHRPQILKVGDTELLCVPNTRMQGRNWHVDYKFYRYEDGVLRNVPYAAPKASQ